MTQKLLGCQKAKNQRWIIKEVLSLLWMQMDPEEWEEEQLSSIYWTLEGQPRYQEKPAPRRDAMK